MRIRLLGSCWVACLLLACEGRIGWVDQPGSDGDVETNAGGSGGNGGAGAGHVSGGGGGNDGVGGAGGAGGGSPPIDCSRIPPVGTQVLRLTKEQYLNSLKDLTGLALNLAPMVPEDPSPSRAGSLATALVVREDLAFAQRGAAEAVAAAVIASPSAMARVVTCTTRDDACTRSFIRTFGRRAFRRPLSTAEADALFALAKRAPTFFASVPPFEAGVRLVLEAVFMSPHFIYRVEADGAVTSPGVRVLTPYERASRLSFLYWNSTPDDALLAAAESGALADAGTVKTQAERLVQDPRARTAVRRYFARWLSTDRYASLSHDAAAFPAFTDAARGALADESLRFVEDTVFDANGTFESLFTSTTAFVGRDLAPLYGLPASTPVAPTRVQLDSTRRAGLLTRAGFLASHAQFGVSSPIQRGVFILRNVLCRTLPDPPPNALAGAGPSTGATTRERTASTTSPASCTGCHGLINPLGYMLESFDAVGQHRTMENGVPVDTMASTVLDGAPVSVSDGLDLSRKLGRSNEARECYASNWLAYAAMRPAESTDRCETVALASRLGQPGYRLKDALVDLSQTRTFLFRADEGP